MGKQQLVRVPEHQSSFRLEKEASDANTTSRCSYRPIISDPRRPPGANLQGTSVPRQVERWVASEAPPCGRADVPKDTGMGTLRHHGRDRIAALSSLGPAHGRGPSRPRASCCLPMPRSDIRAAMHQPKMSFSVHILPDYDTPLDFSVLDRYTSLPDELNIGGSFRMDGA